MPRIARGQENTYDRINWFTRVLGELADMYEVGFQILRIEEGLPGTQVFPTTGWEPVASGGGHYSTGHYFAYDNESATGWTPGLGASLGTHRIAWRWKQYSTSAYQTGYEDFELVEQVTGGPDLDYPTYIEPADVRALGLLSPPTDEQVWDAILLWQATLERACRQWFYPRDLTFSFDGDDSDSAHFGVPIVRVDWLKINGSASALDATRYAVYNRKFPMNDRANPKIRLVRPTTPSDMISASWGWNVSKFEKGYQNQSVKGVFGYVEEDGSAPKAIKRALLKLVMEKLTNPIYTPVGEVPPEPSGVTFAGVVISETTDGHSVQYGTSSYKQRRVGLSGLTEDPEILDIIKLYRAPIGIANTSQWSY